MSARQTPSAPRDRVPLAPARAEPSGALHDTGSSELTHEGECRDLGGRAVWEEVTCREVERGIAHKADPLVQAHRRGHEPRGMQRDRDAAVRSRPVETGLDEGDAESKASRSRIDRGRPDPRRPAW